MELSKILAFFEATKGPPFSDLGSGLELSSEPMAKKLLHKIHFNNWV